MGEINIILLTILFITIFDILKYNFFIFSFIALPATFMHEFMHFIFSLILNGKPVSANIIPKRTERGYTLGFVESANLKWYNGIFVALAPLCLLILSYYYFVFFCKDLELSFLSILHIYFLSSLIYGSMPSSQDIKVAFKTSYFLILIFFVFLSYNYLR